MAQVVVEADFFMAQLRAKLAAVCKQSTVRAGLRYKTPMPAVAFEAIIRMLAGKVYKNKLKRGNRQTITVVCPSALAALLQLQRASKCAHGLVVLSTRGEACCVVPPFRMQHDSTGAADGTLTVIFNTVSATSLDKVVSIRTPSGFPWTRRDYGQGARRGKSGREEIAGSGLKLARWAALSQILEVLRVGGLSLGCAFAEADVQEAINNAWWEGQSATQQALQLSWGSAKLPMAVQEEAKRARAARAVDLARIREENTVPSVTRKAVASRKVSGKPNRPFPGGCVTLRERRWLLAAARQ